MGSSSGFTLTLAHIGGKRYTRACPDGVLVIGRSAKAELQIVDATISSLHTRLTVQGGRAWVEDLGSKNGTWVQGRRLPPGEIATLPADTAARLGELFSLSYGSGPLPDAEMQNPFAFSFDANEGDQTADNAPIALAALRAQSGELNSPSLTLTPGAGAAGGDPPRGDAPPAFLPTSNAPVPSRGSEPSFAEPPSVALPWLSAPDQGAAFPAAAFPAAAFPAAAFPAAPPPAAASPPAVFPAAPGAESPVPARRAPDANQANVKGRIVFGSGSDVVEFSSSAQHPTRNPAKAGTATMVQMGPAPSTRPGRPDAGVALPGVAAPRTPEPPPPASRAVPSVAPVVPAFPARPEAPAMPAMPVAPAAPPMPAAPVMPAAAPQAPSVWRRPEEPRPSRFDPPAPNPRPAMPSQWGQPPSGPPSLNAPWAAPDRSAQPPSLNLRPEALSSHRGPPFGSPAAPPSFRDAPRSDGPSRASLPTSVAPAYDALPPLAIPGHVREGSDFALPTHNDDGDGDDDELKGGREQRRGSPAKRDRPARDQARGRHRGRRRKSNPLMLPLLVLGGILTLGGAVWLFLRVVTGGDNVPAPVYHRRPPATEAPARAAPGRR